MKYATSNNEAIRDDSALLKIIIGFESPDSPPDDAASVFCGRRIGSIPELFEIRAPDNACPGPIPEGMSGANYVGWE